MCDKICLHRNGTATRFSFVRRKRGKKNRRAKNLSRKIGRSPHPPGFPIRPPPSSLPYPLTWYPLPCHRRPLACIFMKSLFRTTIHRDEQRTMTASAAEMRRWKLYEEGKKKESRERGGGEAEGETGIHSRGRKGWYKREGQGSGRWRKSTYANTRHIQPLVPTFVRSVLCDDCR